MNPRSAFSTRLRASGVHLACSAVVAGLAAIVVFLVWYPSPFAAISGGLGLFGLLVSVDVILGPALTAVAASPGKPPAEFRRDLVIIVLLQLAAFSYGLHTIAVARPVFISFEVDRFRVVSANDVETSVLAAAPEPLRALSWTGPKLIAAVKPTDPNELMRATELGLAGIDLSMVPSNWRPIDSAREALWRASRPGDKLLAKHPELTAEVARLAGAAGTSPQGLRFLPIVSRQVSWVALLAAPDARIVGYLPVDGFF